MESLRDMGYDFPSAVADLVDNSIDAGASKIDVTLASEGPHSWVRIADDGMGMTARELDEAMRYGTNRTYGTNAMGHFGLGLKTGSLSQCRRLTVASRRRPNSRIEARVWDLDIIAERDSWDLDQPSPSELPGHLCQRLEGRAGTVVLWEKLDRVLAFRNPSGAHARRALDGAAREVAAHLGMVFHRFIAGEWSDGKVMVEIAVNGEPVEVWDPFSRSESRTRVLSRQVIDLSLEDGGSVEFVVQPYILPSQTQFSSPEAHQTAAGPNRWNRQQGFYIYRRERLIQSGGWNRLRTLDEHAKLARVAVDLPLGHEDLFGINVAKMLVTIPEAARPPLRAIASAVAQEAQRSYRDHLPDRGKPIPLAPDVVTSAKKRPPGAGGPSITGDWPVILRTVSDVLCDQPGRRDDLLLRLANAF